jgi:hypothetical protein
MCVLSRAHVRVRVRVRARARARVHACTPERSARCLPHQHRVLLGAQTLKPKFGKNVGSGQPFCC